MSSAVLIEKFEKLSPEAQNEIEKMIAQLWEKEKENQQSATKVAKPRAQFGELKGFVKYIGDDFDEPLVIKEKLPREFGSLKGFINNMADDFDAPMEEFKDYM